MQTEYLFLVKNRNFEDQNSRIKLSKFKMPAKEKTFFEE